MTDIMEFADLNDDECKILVERTSNVSCGEHFIAEAQRDAEYSDYIYPYVRRLSNDIAQ